MDVCSVTDLRRRLLDVLIDVIKDATYDRVLDRLHGGACNLVYRSIRQLARSNGQSKRVESTRDAKLSTYYDKRVRIVSHGRSVCKPTRRYVPEIADKTARAWPDD